MFNPVSPLYIKPRLDPDFLKWSWAFNKSCNQKHVEKAAPVIRDMSVLSQELMTDIKKGEGFTFHYDKKGLFMLCQTEEMLEEEVKVAEYAQKLGLVAREINQEEIKKMEPNAKINALGAAYFECDHHSTPHEFMTELKTHLTNSGVKIFNNETVEDIKIKNNIINSVKTDKQEFIIDEVVMAAGSWTGILAKKLGVKLLLQAGKGYSINTEIDTGITIPAILAEAKAAVTPMNGFTRFAGTMEIAGINHNINKVRVDTIAKAASQYYPNVKITQIEKENAACGLRPVSPDGLPYIGRSQKCNNLTIAAGHAMMGWSMSTATGKLVSEIISEQNPSLDLEPFSPDRKFKSN
jgi:D-amino-acid dehydrogenase